jgi:hypothetical protein
MPNYRAFSHWPQVRSHKSKVGVAGVLHWPEESRSRSPIRNTHRARDGVSPGDRPANVGGPAGASGVSAHVLVS